jgi:pimeloyl-ACP methyl ester carboxylesterase
MMTCFTNGSVTSTDGTPIGYRQIGRGPGLVLVHGGLNAGQHLMRLAEQLSDTFTVYIPDRRGRGLSPYTGEDYNLAKQCDDMQALLAHTQAERIFGHSVGGIVALFAALAFKSIRKLAVYEPPLSINGSAPAQWFPRCCLEIDQGDYTRALVTALTGMKLAPPLFLWLPRFVLIPLLKWANADDAKNAKDGFVSITELIPTLKMDVPLVLETENRWQALEPLRADVLLLGAVKVLPTFSKPRTHWSELCFLQEESNCTVLIMLVPVLTATQSK